MSKHKKPLYIILDWAGNKPFGEKTFRDFEDAWDFLYGSLEKRLGIPQNEAQEQAFEEELEGFHVEELGGENE